MVTIVTRAGKGSALTHNEMDTNFTNLNSVTVPIGGTVMWWSAILPDSSWLELNGQGVSTTTYSGLFSILGYTYGGSAGTFYLPDTRGIFVRGWAHGNGVDPDVASRSNRGDGAVGDNIGTRQDDDYKAHKHMIPFTSGFGNDKYGLGTDSGAGTFNLATESGSGTDFSSQMPVTGGNETRPKNIYAMYIIKARAV